MRKAWTESDAKLLRELREKAGLSQARLAKLHLISSGQIRELEGEKSGSFYSENIKAYVGYKILLALGYVAPTEPINPALAEQTSAQPMASEIVLQEAVSKPVAPEPDYVSSSTAPASKKNFGLALLLVLSITVAIISVFIGRKSSDTVARSSYLNETATDVKASNANVIKELQVQPATQDVQVNVTDAKVSMNADATELKGFKTLAFNCETTLTPEPTIYQSPVSDKPSNYLYLQALADAQVCLIDSERKTRLLSLKAGESFNMLGVAPFAVRTTQWNDLKIFFQGMRVKLESELDSHNVLVIPHQGAR